jgi:EAL domain-containing protein (putative c-di-GMP-specific phosphodiesterase class I)
MLKLHVNISSPDLSRASLADQTLKSLADAGLQPDCLFLEITETTLMSGLTKVLTVMSRLRDAGVRFSIDDFGTGYSSLAYLSTLPIDNLKIDRSFVVNMETAPQNAEIVRAITSLAATLGRGVVAEGIETSAQLDMLRDLGIDTGQGYLLSRPVAPEAIEQLLADQAGGERLELLEHST